VIAFHDGGSAKTMNVSLKDTPARGATSVSPLFGDGKAELAGDQLKLTLPPKSFSIFVLQ